MEAEIVSALAEITRQVRRAFDARARAIGVTRPQWQVLTLINRNPGINQGGLADMLEVEPITVGRMIDRLQDADMVERRADPADRRAWRLHLTAKGHALIDQLRPLANDMFDEAFAGFAPHDKAALIDLLGRMRANFGSKAEPLPVMVSHG
jgi:DNA-binding MarR family transcriptional regulator